MNKFRFRDNLKKYLTLISLILILRNPPLFGWTLSAPDGKAVYCLFKSEIFITFPQTVIGSINGLYEKSIALYTPYKIELGKTMPWIKARRSEVVFLTEREASWLLKLQAENPGEFKKTISNLLEKSNERIKENQEKIDKLGEMNSEVHKERIAILSGEGGDVNVAKKLEAKEKETIKEIEYLQNGAFYEQRPIPGCPPEVVPSALDEYPAWGIDKNGNPLYNKP